MYKRCCSNKQIYQKNFKKVREVLNLIYLKIRKIESRNTRLVGKAQYMQHLDTLFFI